MKGIWKWLTENAPTDGVVRPTRLALLAAVFAAALAGAASVSGADVAACLRVARILFGS